jgi:FKBP-type peptidyl-prolyl cis-trans isomerase FkpA
LKRQKLSLLLVAGLLALAACTRLNTPEEKAGYAVGLKIGQNLGQIKDRVDLGQVFTGFQDELAGKATMDETAVRAQLQQLNPQAPAGDKGQMGYAVGVSIGKNLAGIKDNINPARVISGIKDQMAGKPKMDPDAVRAALDSLTQAQAAKNKAAGDAFLAENQKKPGVIVTASGLQYQVITPGSGRKPKASSTVKVNYVGTTTDGKEFDASEKHGGPATFPVTGVIKGWTEALQLMPVGSKFHLVIPSELAYGAQGTPNGIGPDSVLIFDVELLAIVK